MEKSRYMVLLFLASLTLVAVAKDYKVNHAQQLSLLYSPNKIENLHSPIYLGDSNVTAGRSFYIQCITDSPVEWFKEEEPLKIHMIRHSKDDFNYRQNDERTMNSSRVRSTLSVNHALSRHSGKYRCNNKHRNYHKLEVIGERKIELGSLYDYDLEDDHNEVRESNLQSTMVVFVEEVTKSSHVFSIDDSIEDSHDVEVAKISDKMYELETEEEREEEDERMTEKNVVKIELNGIDKSHENLQSLSTTTTEIVITTIIDSSTTTVQNSIEIAKQTKHHHRHHQAKLVPLDDTRVLFQITKPIKLGCKADEMEKITWKKDNKNVEDIPNFSNHYKIHKEEGKFIIDKSREEDAGNYSCHFGSESVLFEVGAQVIVRIPENIYVVENEKLDIACIVRGSSPEITWEFSNSTEENAPRHEISEDDHIKLEENEDIVGSRLVIQHVELAHRGKYYCIGTNQLMRDLNVNPVESDGIVRVKDKLAALWPFLGICAEVFILCTIILIYEKRRNKTDLDESDTDQSPDQKNDHHKDSDVRHRK